MTRHQKHTNRPKLSRLATLGTAHGAADQRHLWKGDLSTRVWLPSFALSLSNFPFNSSHFSLKFLCLFVTPFHLFSMASSNFTFEDTVNDWAGFSSLSIMTTSPTPTPSVLPTMSSASSFGEYNVFTLVGGVIAEGGSKQGVWCFPLDTAGSRPGSEYYSFSQPYFHFESSHCSGIPRSWTS